MSEENVKVAVRVRPFNKREIARDAKLIVEMKGSTTYLTDPENPDETPRKFAYDFSYWSHDGSVVRPDGYCSADPKHPNGKIFDDQKTVYDDLGVGVLKNAWEGYNSTLFAYGQTGSGKSWSVVGYGVNKGIVPQFCENIFKEIDTKKASGEQAEYEVTFSMLEIYMEVVQDLLKAGKSKGGLKVRQHPKKGFYCEGLTVTPVGSYAEIEAKIEEGTLNRTVASTNMNATSSRAHTIVGITLNQKFKNAAGEDTTKGAVVNLVDLAGSERAESTGATGDRLKEGAAINQSLSSLGNVISALADRSSGKNVKVPFRDSVLTKLLKNALGGNSKTIMIAAISPADINYDETLSTLRYADRAKQIKCKVSVNEDPTEKLIRELQEENEKLRQMFAGGKIELPKGTGEDGIEEEDGMTEAEKAELRKELEENYKAEMEENEREMEEMKKAFEEKLKEARESGGGVAEGMHQVSERRKKEAHIYNLNFDNQLSGKIVHFLDLEKETVGNAKGEKSDIVLNGPSIQPQHAVFTCEGGKYYLEKLSPTARLLINGEPAMQKTELHHHDRLMFGTTQLYVFSLPKEKAESKEKFEQVTYEQAQEEIAAHSGNLTGTSEHKTKDDLLLEEDLIDMVPAVEEANSISEELDKKKKFELVIVPGLARGEINGRKMIFVRVTDIETDLEWMWPKEKFLNRKFVMQEMFQKFEDEEEWQVPPEKDPFSVDPDEERHIGSVAVWLKSVAFMVDIKEQLELVDYKGDEVGLVNVEVIPCDKKGKELAEKDLPWIDKPGDLMGLDLNLLVKINSARGLPKKYTDVCAKMKWYSDENFTCTKPIKDTINPDWNFKQVFSFTKMTSENVKYLMDGAITLLIMGKQKAPKTKKTANTRETLQKQQQAKGQISAANSNTKAVDPMKVKYAMELVMEKKRAEKNEQKVAQFRELIKLAEEHQKPRISTKLIKELLQAPTKDAAEKCLKMVPKEKGADEDGGGAPSPRPPPPQEKKKPTSKPGEKASGGEKTSIFILL